MQSDLPKQFMLLLDVPILMHTLERFAMAYEDMSIVLVLPQEQVDFWQGMCQHMDFDIPHSVAIGGETRYESVKNGLAACPETEVVGIHDGVRPLVSLELIQRCFDEAAHFGSALPVVPITQSLRRVKGDKSEVVKRDGMVEVQTPQCFTMSELQSCYDSPASDAFTDDATVFEQAGHSIHLVEGEATNLKITTQGDLQIAEALLGGGKRAKS